MPYEHTLIVGRPNQEWLNRTADQFRNQYIADFPAAEIKEDVKVSEFTDKNGYEWLVFWFVRGGTKHFQTFTRFMRSTPIEEWQQGEPALYVE